MVEQPNRVYRRIIVVQTTPETSADQEGRGYAYGCGNLQMYKILTGESTSAVRREEVTLFRSCEVMVWDDLKPRRSLSNKCAKDIQRSTMQCITQLE